MYISFILITCFFISLLLLYFHFSELDWISSPFGLFMIFMSFITLFPLSWDLLEFFFIWFLHLIVIVNFFTVVYTISFNLLLLHLFSFPFYFSSNFLHMYLPAFYYFTYYHVFHFPSYFFLLFLSTVTLYRFSTSILLLFSPSFLFQHQLFPNLPEHFHFCTTVFF